MIAKPDGNPNVRDQTDGSGRGADLPTLLSPFGGLDNCAVSYSYASQIDLLARHLVSIQQDVPLLVSTLTGALPRLIELCKSEPTREALDTIARCVVSAIGKNSEGTFNPCFTLNPDFSAFSDRDKLTFLGLVRSFLESYKGGNPQGWSQAAADRSYYGIDRVAAEFGVSTDALSLHRACEEAEESARTLERVCESFAHTGTKEEKFMQLVTSGRCSAVSDVHSCEAVPFGTERRCTSKYRIITREGQEQIFYRKWVSNGELNALNKLSETGRGPRFLVCQQEENIDGKSSHSNEIVMPHEGVSLYDHVSTHGLSTDMAYEIGKAITDMWSADVVHLDLKRAMLHIWIRPNIDMKKSEVFFIDFSETIRPDERSRRQDFFNTFYAIKAQFLDSAKEILSGSVGGDKPIWQEVAAAFAQGVKDGGYSLEELGITEEDTRPRMMFASPPSEDGNLPQLRSDTRRYLACIAKADAVLLEGKLDEALQIRRDASTFLASNTILFADQFGAYNNYVVQALTTLSETTSDGLMVWSQEGIDQQVADFIKRQVDSNENTSDSLSVKQQADNVRGWLERCPKDVEYNSDVKQKLGTILKLLSFHGVTNEDFSSYLNKSEGEFVDLGGVTCLHLRYTGKSGTYSDAPHKLLDLFFDTSDKKLRAVVVNYGYGHSCSCKFVTDEYFYEALSTFYPEFRFSMSAILSPEYGRHSRDLTRLDS